MDNSTPTASTPKVKSEKIEIQGVDLENKPTIYKVKPSKAIHHRVIVVGSGPAGWTSALYLSRAQIDNLVLRGPQPGGQLTTTTELENFPSWHGSGPGVMEAMETQALEAGSKATWGSMVACDFSTTPKRLVVYPKKLYTADAVIISTGATARYIGLPSEEKYKNKGVSACATCDGPLFKGKVVCVIGGGDAAMEEAHYLTNICPKVYVIHRRDYFRASKVMLERVKKHHKVEMKVWWVVDEVLGNEQEVTGVRIKNTKTGETEVLELSAVFVAIGHVPNSHAFGRVKGGCSTPLEMDDVGYLKVKSPSTYTSIEGVFAAGDIADKTYRQAITAAATGCKSAIDVERFLGESE